MVKICTSSSFGCFLYRSPQQLLCLHLTLSLTSLLCHTSPVRVLLHYAPEPYLCSCFFSILLYSQCLHCSCQNCLSLAALTLSPKHSTLAFHPIYLYILSIVVTHSAPQVQPVVCLFFCFPNYRSQCHL